MSDRVTHVAKRQPPLIAGTAWEWALRVRITVPVLLGDYAIYLLAVRPRPKPPNDLETMASITEGFDRRTSTRSPMSTTTTRATAKAVLTRGSDQAPVRSRRQRNLPPHSDCRHSQKRLDLISQRLEGVAWLETVPRAIPK
jgi:hypothetical protein